MLSIACTLDECDIHVRALLAYLGGSSVYFPFIAISCTVSTS
jgi:hypothetical protein